MDQGSLGREAKLLAAYNGIVSSFFLNCSINWAYRAVGHPQKLKQNARGCSNRASLMLYGVMTDNLMFACSAEATTMWRAYPDAARKSHSRLRNTSTVCLNGICDRSFH